MDHILIQNLQVSSIVGVDGWERNRPQPLIINATCTLDMSTCGETDLLDASVSYSSLAKTIQETCHIKSYRTMETLTLSIISACFDSYAMILHISVSVEKPKGLLYAKGASLHVSRSRKDLEEDVGEDYLWIRDLNVRTIIGVNPWERESLQNVLIDLKIYFHVPNKMILKDALTQTLNYQTIASKVDAYVAQTRYKTVEALAFTLVRFCILDLNLPKVTVRVSKPSALLYAEFASVEMTREMHDFTESLVNEPSVPLFHTVFLGIGSNLGNRLSHIHSAIQQLILNGQVQLLDTSFLYETDPMYVLDQPKYLNAVLKVGTWMDPESLLVRLKEIEKQSGRNFTEIRNGPRTVDLDILYFDGLEYQSPNLTLPHPRIQEREFVLRPLCDIAPEWCHPTLYRSNETLLGLLKHANPLSDYQCHRVFPLRSVLYRIDQEGALLMGILNVTPDSFSDGGQYNSIQMAVEKANQMIMDGASIIDIGGQSTRPGADEVSEEEELNRVIPVVKAIRQAHPDMCLSVDTYRSSVAEQALIAGADMINDVTGGNRDGDAMRKVWKEFACTVCLMHMRGTPKTMSQLTNYTDVVLDVREALGDLVTITIQKGVYRWNLMIDPGIGFAKTAEQNYELLRKLSEMAKGPCDRLPLLVGVSRKGFIGKSTGSKIPSDAKRLWGTSAACTAAVMGGCHILRVHDVAEMKSVVAVANACRP